MNGIALIASFALPPNSRKYCGPADLPVKIEAYLGGDAALEPEVRAGLEQFEVLTPYLRLIAKSNHRDPFDYEVGEAYWIGNDLLTRVPRDAWREMVRTHFVGTEKLPPEVGEEYLRSINAAAVPHHSFHVLRVFTRTGSIRGMVGPGLKQVNSCKISWGRVTRVTPESFTVMHAPIGIRDGAFRFLPEEEATVQRALPLFGHCIVDANVGEWIAFHWGVACKVLSEGERANLEQYTRWNMLALSP